MVAGHAAHRQAYVADEHTAHDVVQEAWLGVLRGIDRFEARSSLRTWVYRILVNKAKTRGVRDARTIPAGDLLPTGDDRGPTVDPARFRGPSDPYPRHWRSSPPAWPSPEDGAVAAETRRELAAALACLPERQRVVVTLRDVAGTAAKRSATCCRSARPTSGYCCTAGGPRCAPPWNGIGPRRRRREL